MMKVGDVGFCYNDHNVSIYFAVESVSDTKIELEVINGAYTETIEIVNVPENIRGDYNAAINWFKDQRKIK